MPTRRPIKTRARRANGRPSAEARPRPAQTATRPARRDTPPAAELEPPRVVVENVTPRVEDGRFPIKRTVGDALEVRADVFADGHDLLGVVLRHRPEGAAEWSEVAMQPLGNDGWRASFALERAGFHEYTVEAWIDHFASWCEGLAKKFEAGQDVASELLEGAEMLRRAEGRSSGVEREWLRQQARLLASDAPQAERVRVALDAELAARMKQLADRSRAGTPERPLRVRVDRERGRYGAWYEMFPRSAGGDPKRSATFREAERRLPDIAAMGFDVVYLPPIHPIGRTHRKGPNNRLEAGPGDPGSPWAIGAREGGHDAVDPALGTLADFDRFVRAAGKHGLEIALDIAFQCSPDHPYVRQHPEWFRHRPDGSIKYAENPPKKYQDIYPFDFECDDWLGLWHELKRVVLFWAEHGVKIFRVDNPHTKPFRFWEWLIAGVQHEHPGAVFLSEAFTRPKVMRHLAKAGFSQSYTYFTWRNTKPELVDYFTELTRTEVHEYLRPNLFTNTPDILHEFLQVNGRAGFQIRLVLAATLGASYGIYGPPFELCEGRAHPGTEEYVDSEKYQIRVWDHDRPGNIRELVTRVNRARREHPALQRDERLSFHEIDNDQLIAYSKTTADLSNVVLVVVNLDAHHPQQGWVRLPLGELGLPDHEPFQVHDLVDDQRYLWQGERNFVRLDPQHCPAHVFAVRRRLKTEKDFDYYL